MPARAHEWPIALPHVPEKGHVAEYHGGRRRSEHTVRLERGKRPIGATRHLAGGLRHLRRGGSPGVHRRVEVLLVPELGAVRVFLEEVDVVEALGRMVA